jgi:hypothetical protein
MGTLGLHKLFHSGIIVVFRIFLGVKESLGSCYFVAAFLSLDFLERKRGRAFVSSAKSTAGALGVPRLVLDCCQ